MSRMLQSLILGLDGATWDVLLPLMDLGVIPNLKRLVSESTRAPLKSTVPPLTGPAWTTFATGKNPGEHGFFDWGTLDENYVLHMWNAEQVADQPFWQRMSDAGRRVGVFNMPFSYPAEPINGFIMCGLGTPSFHSSWLYPTELRAEVEPMLGPKYSFSFPLLSYAVEEFDRVADDLIELERTRTDILFHLLDRVPVDDLVVVFVGTDQLGHFLGHHMMDFASVTNLETIGPEEAALVRYYRALDVQIGRLLELVGPDTFVAGVSDHGFTASEKIFHVNDWLMRQGYLAATPVGWLKYQLAFYSGAFTQKRNQRLQKQSNSEDTDPMTVTASIVQENRFNAGNNLGLIIDWARTQAFSCSHQGIYINAAGRFAGGIVKQGSEYEKLRLRLRDDLLKVQDPETGERIIEEVFMREEVYTGDKLETMPDLLLRFREERYDSNRYFFGAIDFGLRIGQTVFRQPSPWGRGDHYRNGISFFRGEGFARSAVAPALSIEDMAPIILYKLGLPVPSGMATTVVDIPFQPGYLKAHPAHIIEDPAVKAESLPIGSLSAEEEKLIYDRLRDLGYLE